MKNASSSKIEIRYLLIALAVLVLGFVTCYVTARAQENEYEDIQLSAAIHMKEAEEYLKKIILEKGLAIEKEDLNKTGLIGPEFTELTSTPGNEDAKRTSLNPNFAAAMVRYFQQAGLKKGDAIAIGTSGSFPGLAVASCIAATEMGLETRVMASCGASMHGATRPEFNIFDFLYYLQEGGYASFDMLCVSRGAANDAGGGVFEGVLYEGSAELSLELCKEASLKFGAPVLTIENMEENIQTRLAMYGDDVKLFINVGGASHNSGISSFTLDFPQGLVMSYENVPQVEGRGLNFEFIARGVPVLNLLNVKQLAYENGIEFDAVPMTEPGVGAVYSTVSYNPFIIVAFVVAAIAIVVYGVIRTRSKSTRDDDEL